MELLYKYRAVDKYALPMLHRGTVWLSQPTSFNDPYDCKARLLVPEQENYERKYLAMLVDQIIVALSFVPTRFLKSNYKLSRSKYRELTQRLRRLITEGHEDDALNLALQFFRRGPWIPDDYYPYVPHMIRSDIEARLTQIGVLSLTKQDRHMQMWAHYADNHCGFCLGFEQRAGTQLADRLSLLQTSPVCRRVPSA